MANTPSPTRKTLNLRRGCERSRLTAETLAAAYELLTPILRRAFANAKSTQRRSVGRRQRLTGGQQA